MTNHAMKSFVVNLTFPSGPPPAETGQRQRDFLAGLVDEGVLRLAGRFVDERGGGMSIFRAPSIEQARECFANAPVVSEGHAEADVREWTVTWGEAAE